MSRHFVCPLAFVLCIVGSGCATDPRPPTAADDISSDWAGLGGYRLHAAGDDSAARALVSGQGWQVYNGHNGGIGDTLQIVDPSGSVVLIWAYESLSGFELSEGWTGRTPGGTGIGTSLEEFRQLEPEFVEVSPGVWAFQDGQLRVSAVFEDGKLSRVSVRDF